MPNSIGEMTTLVQFGIPVFLAIARLKLLRLFSLYAVSAFALAGLPVTDIATAESDEIQGSLLSWHHEQHLEANQTLGWQRRGYGSGTADKSPFGDLMTGVSEVMTVKPEQQPSIGTATMEPDGTIVLQLRAEGPGGSIGDALFRYPPDHPEYRSVLDHLGGLHPGEGKPVPPWN